MRVCLAKWSRLQDQGLIVCMYKGNQLDSTVLEEMVSITVENMTPHMKRIISAPPTSTSWHRAARVVVRVVVVGSGSREHLRYQLTVSVRDEAQALYSVDVQSDRGIPPVGGYHSVHTYR